MSWLFWNEIDDRTVVTSQTEQRWNQSWSHTKSNQADPGDYFTLEITAAGKFLTAANGSLQMRGTYRFSSSLLYVKDHLFRSNFFKNIGFSFEKQCFA